MTSTWGPAPTTEDIFTITNNKGIVFSAARSGEVTLGPDFKEAVHKEIREYLKKTLEIDLIRWNGDDATIQISCDGQILSEKSFTNLRSLS